MKIRKSPVVESKVKLRQAQELAQRPLSAQESSTIGGETNSIRRASRALRSDSINSITKPLRIYPGTPALVEPINELTLTVGEDLRVLADSTLILENDLVEIYNQAATKETDLIGQIKSLRNKLVTLSLYKDGLSNSKYLVYSFDDASDLKEGTLTVHEEEGHLTLPVSQTKVIPIKRVEASGSGRPGNNSDRSRGLHNNVESVVDSNGQTWFEYERVSTNPGGSLTLTLKLELETPTVVNRIVITPVNFGTSRWVSIEDIQAVRGEFVESIKPEILQGTGRDTLQLAPATSKFAGAGIFTFYPREVSSIYVKFTQSESYPILRGRLFRTAIGIKEIELSQIQFDKEGIFTLSNKIFNSAVLGIGLRGTVTLAPTSDYSLSLEVRVNDDAAWVPAQLLSDSDSIQEVITDKLVSTVQIRGKLARADQLAAQGGPRVKPVIRTHLRSFGTGEIELDGIPKSFIEIIETGYGAVGASAPPLFLGRANGLPEVVQTFNCPILIDTTRSYVEVNGKRWDFVPVLEGADDEGVLYFPNRSSGQIQIGDGVAGKLPPAGAEIYLQIRAEEQTVFTETETGFSGELLFPADKIKELTRVYYRDFDIREGQARLGPLGQSFTIDKTHQSVSITRLEVDGEELAPEGEISFQNGTIEFADLDPEDGPYFSVDRVGQKIYLSTPIGANSADAIVEYGYQLKQLIPSSGWDFSDTENKIVIHSPLFKIKTSERTIADQINERVLKLVGNVWLGEDYTLIKHSVVPVNLNGTIGVTRTLENELSFIDGATEFNQVIAPGISLLGFYSIDYKNARIHLPPQDDIAEADRGFLPGKILFQYVGAEIEYGVGAPLVQGVDFESVGSKVRVGPGYLRRTQGASREAKVHIRYDLDAPVVRGGKDITRFFSPLIKDLTVVGSGVDSRLGALTNV